jgi:hypothetical protein
MIDMSGLSKLLGITAIGASIAKARLLQRFVHDMASVITLSIATGLMAGALLIGGFYIAYQGLVRYGLEPLAAQILLAGAAFIALMIMLNMMRACFRRIKSIPGQLIQPEFPLPDKLNNIADSFLDGLMGGLNHPKEK